MANVSENNCKIEAPCKTSAWQEYVPHITLDVRETIGLDISMKKNEGTEPIGK